MNNILIKVINYLIVIFLIFTGCKILKNKYSAPFIFSDASYYSWFAGKDEHGTNIQIKLKNAEAGVEFDSLIFRNIKIPVYASEEENEILLRGVIPGDSYRFTKKDLQRVEKSNRLIYNYREKRCIYILKDIRREPMRYY